MAGHGNQLLVLGPAEARVYRRPAWQYNRSTCRRALKTANQSWNCRIRGGFALAKPGGARSLLAPDRSQTRGARLKVAYPCRKVAAKGRRGVGDVEAFGAGAGDH